MGADGETISLLSNLVLPLPVMMGLYTTFLCLWLASIGGAIGSFLNVVVYRMPLQMQLSSPGSRCPRCLSAIRARHNIPVLGWLMLRGRCYDCGLPISSRYPAVELTLAIVYSVLGYFLAIGAPFDLCPFPLQRWVNTPHGGIEGVSLWVRYGLQMLLLTTLLAVALIAYDRRPVPLRIFLSLLLLSLALPFLWPEVHHWPGILQPDPGSPASVAITLSLGLAFALVSSVILLFTVSSRTVSAASYDTKSQAPAHNYQSAIAISLIATGIVLGWQRLVLVSGFVFVFVPLAIIARRIHPTLARAGTVSSWLLFALFAAIMATLLTSEHLSLVHTAVSRMGIIGFILGIGCFFVSGIALRFGMPADYDGDLGEPVTTPPSPLETPTLQEDHGSHDQPASDSQVS